MKKRVSNRRAVSPLGVIQWLIHGSESVASRQPVLGAQRPHVDAAVVDRGAVRQRGVAVGTMSPSASTASSTRPPRSTRGSRRPGRPRRLRRRLGRPCRRGTRTCRWRTRRRGAPQHEHLQPVGRVAQQHHGCCGLGSGTSLVGSRRSASHERGDGTDRSPTQRRIVSARAGMDGSGDDRARPGAQRDRRDRHDRHRRRAQRHRRGPRPGRPSARGGARADGAGRRRHAHQERPARRDPRIDDLARRRRRATLEFIKEHVPEGTQVPLCGNSIGMDRRFLAAYLPEIENYLHYRSVDVSSVKELVRRWYPDLNQRPQPQGRHAPRARRHPREHRRAAVLPRARVRADAGPAAGVRSPSGAARTYLMTAS